LHHLLLAGLPAHSVLPPALRLRKKTRPRIASRPVLFSEERDQSKWAPVLRPIALQNIEIAHDLVVKPLALWRIMRSRR
jgi:hypothetical protein